MKVEDILKKINKKYGTQEYLPKKLLWSGYIEVGDFYDWFLVPKIKRYEKFNRKEVWDQDDDDSFEESIFDGDVYNPLVENPLESSIENAMESGNKKDEEFFRLAYNDGEYTWLTIIGGNRGEMIDRAFKRKTDKEIEIFRKQLVPISITSGLDRVEIHRKFQKDARGVVPNAQEMRNSIWLSDKSESDWVRKVAKEHKHFLTKGYKIEPAQMKRMGDDEFIAKTLLHYNSHGVFGNYNKMSADENVDYLYHEKSTHDSRKGVLKTLEYLETLHDNFPDKFTYGKNWWQSQIVIEGVMRDWGVTWKDKKTSPKLLISEFDSWRDNLIVLSKSDDPQDREKAMIKPVTSKLHSPLQFHILILRFTYPKEFLTLKHLLEKFVEDMLKKGILKMGESDDLATKEQHRKLLIERKVGNKVLVRQNGQVNGEWFAPIDEMPEFILVDYSEVKNQREKFPVDHIIPKDEGGETKCDNMEITISEYNNWKRKRFPNYSKVSLDEIIQKS